MLDDKLNADERRALLLLLTIVALEDGHLSESEVRFIQRLATPIGVELGALLVQVDDAELDTLVARLGRPLSRRIAVLELVRLAHVDGVYAKVERERVLDVARRVDLSHEQLEWMEDWAAREWALWREAERRAEQG